MSTNNYYYFLVLINAGSRFEASYPSGISHFLEKLAFNVSNKNKFVLI